MVCSVVSVSYLMGEWVSWLVDLNSAISSFLRQSQSSLFLFVLVSTTDALHWRWPQYHLNQNARSPISTKGHSPPEGEFGSKLPVVSLECKLPCLLYLNPGPPRLPPWPPSACPSLATFNKYLRCWIGGFKQITLFSSAFENKCLPKVFNVFS